MTIERRRSKSKSSRSRRASESRTPRKSMVISPLLTPTPTPTPSSSPTQSQAREQRTLQQRSKHKPQLATIDEREHARARHRAHPSYGRMVRHMAQPLCPLVSVSTGRSHPRFPRSILAYHLLTSSQLDDLARHYHQVTPSVPETFEYPLLIPSWIRSDGKIMDAHIDIETKRRRIGRFVGLRGCETPTRRASAAGAGMGMSKEQPPSLEGLMEAFKEAQAQAHFDGEEASRVLLEQMEKAWEEALKRARMDDEDGAVLRRKAGGY